MGKQPEEEGPKGAPEWVVTFTDMISLLVTFFVLLMTYSSMNPRDFVKISSFLDTHAGVLNTDHGDVAAELTETALASNQDPLRGGEEPHTRPPEHLYENLEEMGQKQTPEDQAVDLSQARDGLTVEFDSKAAFAPGSAEVTPDLKKNLEEIAEVLQFYSYLVVVEGFTDDHFRPTAQFPSADSLSMQRARAAAAVLTSSGVLSPDLLQLAGLGAEQPRASNVTPEGRQLNRRVRLRIMALSTTRQAVHDAAKAAKHGGL